MGGNAVDGLPGWVTLVRAPNPGPMTLDGTNTWVLRAPGADKAVVIDPGPLDEGHLGRIAELGPYGAILATHSHHDHVEGVPRLVEMLGGVPVGEIPADLGLRLDVVPTPGHTADSVCFVAAYGNDRVIFTGDTILGRGTTVVALPDGDLGDYLASLERLSAYEGTPMLPGHGPIRPDVSAVVRGYQEHRRERLAQVEAAMASGADTPEKVVDLVYAGIDPRVRFAAVASAAAQLNYLRHKNRESGTPPDGLDRL